MKKVKYYVTGCQDFIYDSGRRGTAIYPHTNKKKAVEDAKSEANNVTNGATSHVCTVDDSGNLYAVMGYKKDYRGCVVKVTAYGYIGNLEDFEH